MKNSYYLSNGVFLFALFILLFNDFYLKACFHDVLTGKLSDLSGLTVFVFFFTFLVGNRFKILVFITTALLFCWWKSFWSTGFISNWNELFPFYSIERVVDYTDLICLTVLIPLYFYQPKNTLLFSKQLTVAPILLLSVFAIAATSKAKNIHSGPPYTYQIIESFKLKMTQAEFLENLSLSNIKVEKNLDAVQPKNPNDFHYYILRNFTFRNGLDIESMKIGINEKNKWITIGIEEVSVLTPPEESVKAFRKLIVEESKNYFAL
jgi:hypothetical protein